MKAGKLEIESFLNLVYEMREAQKSYFRCRDSYNLRVSKELEKKVDKALKAIKYGEAPKQDSLI